MLQPVHAGRHADGHARLLLLGDGPVRGGAGHAEDGPHAGWRHEQRHVRRSRRRTASPKSNGARQIWVTETGLATALITSYMAEQMAMFGIVVGIALLLSGIGFIDPRPQRRAGERLLALQAWDEQRGRRCDGDPAERVAQKRPPSGKKRGRPPGRPLRYSSGSAEGLVAGCRRRQPPAPRAGR